MSKDQILEKFITTSGKLNSRNAKFLEDYRKEITVLTCCASKDIKEKLYWIANDKTNYEFDDYSLCRICKKYFQKPFQNTSVGYCWNRREPNLEKEHCGKKCQSKDLIWKAKFTSVGKYHNETNIEQSVIDAKQYLSNNLYNNNGKVNGNLIRDMHPSFIDMLMNTVSENFEFNDDISELIYWFINDLEDYPKYCICGKPITFFKGFSYKTREFCSPTCSMTSEKTRDKIKKTCLERYGVPHVAQAKSTRAKYEQTCMLRYGVRNVSQDPTIFKKIIKNQMKWKNYEMPSGKIVRIQGYEDKALDILLSKYAEVEIKVHDVPKFQYEVSGKKHTYFPDLFIPKENLIIEVKSIWTLKIQKNNDLKFAAVKRAGYNFKLMVL